MPVTLANALLAFVPDRSVPIRGAERVGVVSPMFNEESGAADALVSLLNQTEQFDELAVTVNGGTDRTADVVRAILTEHGFRKVHDVPSPDFPGGVQRWHRPGGPAAMVLEHLHPTSKADSINSVVAGEYLTTARVLVVDGDTVFAPAFLANLKDNFYRLSRRRRGKKVQYVIEDFALQSGAVMSSPPKGGSFMAHLISLSRSGEYAAAALLRQGQTARPAKRGPFSRSRLYTAVGCGFVARQESFPMPADTITEDHDFSLSVQNGDSSEEATTVAELERGGFVVKFGGLEMPLSDLIGNDVDVVFRRTSDARFVPGALMYTDDPLNIPGYLRQVERWNGGGIENAIKRGRREPRRALRGNVAFAAFSAQAENLLGLVLLLFLLPLALGLNTALPGQGTALGGLAIWLAVDLLTTVVLIALGFHRVWKANGLRGARLAWRVVSSTLLTSLPLLSLRLVNAVAYVIALSRVAPGALRKEDLEHRTNTTTWERPRSLLGGRIGARATGVTVGLALSSALLFATTFVVADYVRPNYRSTWQLINKVDEPIRFEDHSYLPLPRDRAPLAPVVHEQLVMASPPPVGGAGVSLHCSAAFVPLARPVPERLADLGSSYRPLSYWELLMLARLVPLAANLEEAARAYDVPLSLLFEVLLNESYLDPLAIGDTGDVGLSQVTADALALLSSISAPDRSDFRNAYLFGNGFNVFDPDFSICAGAAKLAWARAQPGGGDDRFAYARYINPLNGVRGNELNPLHAELVASLAQVKPLVDALSSTFAVFASDRARLQPEERALLNVYTLVEDGDLDIEGAYRQVQVLVTQFSINDREFYRDVLAKLYGTELTTAVLPAAATY